MRKQKGFTIIELVVVIAIIAILAAIIIANVNGHMSKARDARRKADVAQIIQALELYYFGRGVFPYGEFDSTCGTKITGTDPFSVALKTDNIMTSAPNVPSNSGSSSCGDAYYAGSWPQTPSPQNAAVYVSLENADPNCKTPIDWTASGIYCSGGAYKNIYLKVLGN